MIVVFVNQIPFAVMLVALFEFAECVADDAQQGCSQTSKRQSGQVKR